MKLRLFQMVVSRLEEAPEGRIDAHDILDDLGRLLPYDQPAKLLETLVAWGRYAEVIDFDQNANVVHLYEAITTDEEDDSRSD
jgi:NitT/TauT family transport system ATP-binding protein